MLAGVKGLRKKKRRIIPMKLMLGFALGALIVWPGLLYLAFSCASLLLYRSIAPTYVYITGLIIGSVYEIYFILKTDYGILVKNGLFTYAPYTVNVFAEDDGIISLKEIKEVRYKRKGEEWEKRKDWTNRNVIIIVIDQYTYYTINLLLYSRRQIKKILAILVGKQKAKMLLSGKSSVQI